MRKGVSRKLHGIRVPARLLALVWVLVVPPLFSGEGPVALQSADPGCGDDSSAVYVDCGNGTFTDNRTGLIWLADANCFGEMTWYEAMSAVAGLADLGCEGFFPDEPCDCDLSDGSSPGEWRLPTLSELEQMTEDGESMGCSPAITNDSGAGFPNACWSEMCVQGGGCTPFDVQGGYWSASTWLGTPAEAWYSLIGGSPGRTAFDKTFAGYVWPVRGGQ